MLSSTYLIMCVCTYDHDLFYYSTLLVHDQVHPQGWCAVSRNITSDERSEWTCVHDIQEQPIDENTVNSNVDYSCTDEPHPGRSVSVDVTNTSRPQPSTAEEMRTFQTIMCRT